MQVAENFALLRGAGAAPHLPAGLPVNGKKGAVIDGSANYQRCKNERRGYGQRSSPRSRGEGAGRRMRGSADLKLQPRVDYRMRQP
ncbi:MAG: hypothetical protein EOR48_18515 [Mesorhizobium sp.]|nr:MAG: hypothetical protein EOR48_18515 [Mesorhizobium sp.]TIP40822.1 MAG: hypothetical protein E5X62_27060 [Mesorhizobium sp.]